jgi:hypothetical protein
VQRSRKSTSSDGSRSCHSILMSSLPSLLHPLDTTLELPYVVRLKEINTGISSSRHQWMAMMTTLKLFLLCHCKPLLMAQLRMRMAPPLKLQPSDLRTLKQWTKPSERTMGLSRLLLLLMSSKTSKNQLKHAQMPVQGKLLTQHSVRLFSTTRMRTSVQRQWLSVLTTLWIQLVRTLCLICWMPWRKAKLKETL